ncbi:uncharacterized protein LOC144348587 [Saccoglossus kowalevskii]
MLSTLEEQNSTLVFQCGANCTPPSKGGEQSGGRPLVVTPFQNTEWQVPQQVASNECWWRPVSTTVGNPIKCGDAQKTAMNDGKIVEELTAQVTDQQFAGSGQSQKPSTIQPIKSDDAQKTAINDGKTVEELTAQVTDQGGVVRMLKTAKADKVKIEAEVKKLLELKRQLSLVKGEEPAPSSGGKGK